MPKKYTNTGGHSKAFTPPDRARSRQYALKDVPARLWLRVQAKAKTRKISIRALILGLLTRWLDGDIVHPYEPQHPAAAEWDVRPPDPDPPPFSVAVAAPRGGWSADPNTSARDREHVARACRVKHAPLDVCPDCSDRV